METPRESDKHRPKKTLIIIPRLDDSGPVKGAIALLIGLQNLGVEAICLPMEVSAAKPAADYLDMRVAEASGWGGKIKALREIVARTDLAHEVSIVSFCFRPDVLVVISGLRHVSICSLRGNLRVNYGMQYGVAGWGLAILHYAVAILHARTVVLNQTMFHALRLFRSRLTIIENFINEPPITRERKARSTPVFLFIGGLTRRKGVVELIDAFSEVKKRGREFNLLILGQGPERERAERHIFKHHLSDHISLVGQVEDPFGYLVNSDFFVLPSYSEGTSRAAMEALYSGVPCIMRDVDSNSELLVTSKQGELFSKYEDLVDILESFCHRSLSEKRENLLPHYHRQETGAQQYLDLIHSLNER